MNTAYDCIKTSRSDPFQALKDHLDSLPSSPSSSPLIKRVTFLDTVRSSSTPASPSLVARKINDEGNENNIEKQRCFYSNDSHDRFLRNCPNGTYLLRFSRLDKGEQAPERYYVLVYVNKNTVRKLLIKVEYEDSVIPIFPKKIVKYTHCITENGEIKEIALSYKSLSKFIKYYIKNPIPYNKNK